MNTSKKISKLMEEAGYHYVTSTAKTVLPNDGFEARPAYHIRSNDSMRQEDTTRVYSRQEQEEYLRTAIEAGQAGSAEDAELIWGRFLAGR
jgi:hypothetical protein